MLKPDLRIFEPGELAPAEGFNYNFEQMGNYVFGSVDELKALVNSAVANLTLQLNQSVFTGMIIPYAGKVENIPIGWLLCDGREVSREEYRKLYEAIDIEKYGKGDGVTTFNLPNYIDMFLEGGTEAGIVKEAGLPDLTLYTTQERVRSQNGYDRDGTVYVQNISYLASSQNAIYGKSNTVQPPSVTTLFIIKT